MHNKAVNADAQRVRAAARPTLSGRRLLLRCAAQPPQLVSLSAPA